MNDLLIIMHFCKQQNCLLFVKIIVMQDFTSFIVCDCYFSVLSSCIIMTNHTKCFKCTHLNYSCVSVSLKSLNHAHLHLKSELETVINECVKQIKHLFKLNVKVVCLFRALKQNEFCTIIKIHCVTSELNDNNNETMNDKNLLDPFNLNFLLKMMSFNLFNNSESLLQTALMFLCS